MGELKYLLNAIQLKSNDNEFNFGGFNDLGESILFLALEQDRMSLMDLPSNNQQKEEEYDDDENKDEQKEEPSVQNKVDLDIIINLNEEQHEISDQTLLNVLHFMVYRAENDPKKYGEIITVNDEKYI